MHVTLKLDDSGCRIHSISDADKEIVTNNSFVVMPWKMVTRRGVSVSIKEAVEEIAQEGEERRLVSEFLCERRDEIDEIFREIDYIDEGYVKERYPEIYNFGLERLGIHFENQLVIESYTTGTPIKRGYDQLDNFKKLIKAYNGYDSDAYKYVKRVRELIDIPMDRLKLEDVRLAGAKVKSTQIGYFSVLPID